MAILGCSVAASHSMTPSQSGVRCTEAYTANRLTFQFCHAYDTYVNTPRKPWAENLAGTMDKKITDCV